VQIDPVLLSVVTKRVFVCSGGLNQERVGVEDTEPIAEII